MILSAKGEDFASNFSTLLLTAEKLGMGETVSAKVDEKIQTSIIEGMMKKFGEMIPAKVASKGVEVECQPATCEQEAEIFFNILERVNELTGATGKQQHNK